VTLFYNDGILKRANFVKKIMQKIDTTVRIIWGLHYAVFGLNKFLFFLPVNASNDFAQKVIDSFYETGYLMQFVGLFQVISGLMLLFNRYLNLAILIALPVSFNILTYTIFTANFGIQSVTAAAIVIGANIYFVIRRRKEYSHLFN
jgi:putative oxidoreductase